jgi:hypothetical protein
MTAKERKLFLEEAKKSGKISLYKEAQIYCNYKEILDVTTHPREFKKVWDAVPNSTKLLFIQQSMKYVLKEKGKEMEVSDNEQNRNFTKYDEMAELVEKLSL